MERVRLNHEGLQGFDEAVLELGRVFGDPAVEPVCLHAQPQSLDGIEIGRARWQILRLEVMPVQTLDLLPRGVVQHEDGTASRHRRVLLCPCGEELLERVAVT